MLTILTGDWIEQLQTLPAGSVQMCVTSPPYFNQRNYGVKGQLGLEKTPEAYVAKLVAGFREVHRVLKSDGCLFLNLGDSYAYKSLLGVPWLAAFALRADGWFLRSEITWCKKVPMPESCTDRPTSATEKIFLLTKSARYFYDHVAVRNPPSAAWANDKRWQTGSTNVNEKNGYALAGAQNPKKLHKMFDKQRGHSRRHAGFNDRWDKMERGAQCANGSNMRNYWLLGPEPCAENHFATFPSAVPRKCILAGSRPGDTVLDPFMGSGTTSMVALELGRHCTGIELNPDYVTIARSRCHITPGLPL